MNELKSFVGQPASDHYVGGMGWELPDSWVIPRSAACFLFSSSLALLYNSLSDSGWEGCSSSWYGEGFSYVDVSLNTGSIWFFKTGMFEGSGM